MITGYKDKNEYISEKGIKSVVYLMDCMEGMKQLKDNEIGLSVCDPPYGINVAKMAYTQEDNRPVKQRNGNVLRVKKLKYKHGNWDSHTPDKSYFDELFRVSKNQIIWGVNYMPLKLNGGRIIWNKVVPKGVGFSDCEIAYCSFHERIRLFTYMWAGMFQGKSLGEPTIQQGNKKLNEKRIHPTQKPVKLYDWIFKNYADNDLILDTHLGSQSSRIAANKAGLNFIGFEIDEDYFNAGNKRFKEFVSQMRLF